jgi:5-methylthioadenosine/S-adenosylhomocysteine deaminase
MSWSRGKRRIVSSLQWCCLVAAASLVHSQQAPPVLLLTGGTVVTMAAGQQVFDPGAVAVAGSRIVAVGEAAGVGARYPAARTLDTTGRIVLPGLVNAHTHVPMTLFRGLADDLELMDWLQEHIFPAEAKMVDEELVRWGTRLACLEMLRGGTTTFADMYYFEDAIAEEVERCGMRAVLGETLVDFPSPDHDTWEGAIEYTERFLERWRDHPRIVPAVAPHAPYTVSGEHLIAAHALAETHDAPLLVHLAEDKSEVRTIRERHGRGPVEYLSGLGVLSDRVLAAHVIWPTEGEMRLLAARGVGVAHCPQSNMKLAAGIAPVPRLLELGVAVGLGTDGPASNNDLDLWDEMDTAAKLHKVALGDPTAMDARTTLRLATLGGAEALGLASEIGSLEVGKRADLVVVRTDGYHQTPWFDPYSLLVYSTKASDVESVMVEGEWVVRDGSVRTVDEQAVRKRVATYRAAMAPAPPE